MLDRKYVWDGVWFRESKSFEDIYRKKDDRCLLDRECI